MITSTIRKHGLSLAKQDDYELAVQLQKAIQSSKKNMERAAKEMEFIDAAKYRDEMFALEKMMKEEFGK